MFFKRVKRCRVCVCVCFGILLRLFTASVIVAADADAALFEEKPRWEWGVAASYLIIPHYLGANEYYQKVLPIPYFIYRFDRSDFRGTPTIFYNPSEDTELRISLSLTPPVYSDSKTAGKPTGIDDSNAEHYRDKNYRRRGMRNHSLLLGVGGKLRWLPNRHFEAALNLLYNNALIDSYDGIGFTFSPQIYWNVLGRQYPVRIRVLMAQSFGSLSYNRYFYDVSKKDELPDRPAYSAKEGLISHQVGFFASYTPDLRWFIGGGVFADYLDGAAIKDSPLVVSKRNISRFIFISYSFDLSDEMVLRRLE